MADEFSPEVPIRLFAFGTQSTVASSVGWSVMPTRSWASLCRQTAALPSPAAWIRLCDGGGSLNEGRWAGRLWDCPGDRPRHRRVAARRFQKPQAATPSQTDDADT